MQQRPVVRTIAMVKDCGGGGYQRKRILEKEDTYAGGLRHALQKNRRSSHHSQYTGFSPSLSQHRLLLRAKEKERRSSIVYRYKRRKTLDLYKEKRTYSASPIITTGTRSRVPVPELGHLFGMGAASHRPDARSHRLMGAVSARTPPKPPGQISRQQLLTLKVPNHSLHIPAYWAELPNPPPPSASPHLHSQQLSTIPSKWYPP